MKFRKRPVVIDAVQWVGTNPEEIRAFAEDRIFLDRDENDLFVRTLEGPLTASVLDWIIKGVHGEFYPCKPDIFAATYEPVTE